MLVLTSLENTPLPQLHTVFCEAFGDYSVPIDMPLERFQSNMKRNGYDPSVSVGAYVDGRLVGFIMSGIESGKAATLPTIWALESYQPSEGRESQRTWSAS